MKKIISMLAVFAAYTCLSAAPVIYVVNIGEVYSNFYKAKAAAAQLNSSVEATKQELQSMDAKRQELAKQLNTVREKTNNPALSQEAKEKIAREEGAPIYSQIQQIESEMKTISDQTNERVNKNIQSIRAVHMQEILEVINKIAADKGADFILEKNAAPFAKPQYEITQEVITAVNASEQK